MIEGKRILFLSPQPFFEERGTPIAVRRVVDTLAGWGGSVDFLTYPLGRDVRLADGVRHVRSLGFPGIRRVRPGPSGAKLLLDLPFMAQALGLALLRRYDAIHTVEEAGVAGALLRLLGRGRFVYDMDSEMAAQFGGKGSRSGRVLGAFVGALERWSLRRADVVVTVCQALTERVREIRPGACVVQVEDIPEPAPALANGARAEIRKDLDAVNRPLVMYTGNLERYQGIDLLVDAWKSVHREIPDAVLAVVGGESGQVDSYRKRAEDGGTGTSIRWLGRRPLEEMPGFLSAADVLVSPRIEGLNTPMKIYNYLQSGRPLVATDLPTHTQVLGGDVAVLCAPSPGPFAEGIVAILRDPERGARLGEAGRRYVEKSFNRGKFEAGLAEAYRLAFAAGRGSS
ncbi:MAG: glycosyltransferase family 4 protein [Nitrospirae bacterium]|nr:glycosyltransferase family 4 protein [Nitrospirota bacterium]